MQNIIDKINKDISKRSDSPEFAFTQGEHYFWGEDVFPGRPEPVNNGIRLICEELAVDIFHPEGFYLDAFKLTCNATSIDIHPLKNFDGKNKNMEESDFALFAQITNTNEEEAKKYQNYGYNLQESVELFFSNPIPEEVLVEENVVDYSKTFTMKFDKFNEVMSKMTQESKFPFSWKNTKFTNKKQENQRQMNTFFCWSLIQKNNVLVKVTDNYSIVNSVYEFNLKTKSFKLKNSQVLENFNSAYDTNKVLSIEGEIYLVSQTTAYYSEANFKIEKLSNNDEKIFIFKTPMVNKYDIVHEILSYQKKIYIIFSKFKIFECDLESLRFHEFQIEDYKDHHFDVILQHKQNIYCFKESENKIFVFSLLDQTTKILNSNMKFQFSNCLPFAWENYIFFFSEHNFWLFDIDLQFWNLVDYFGTTPRNNSFLIPFYYEKHIYFFPESCNNNTNIEYLNSISLDDIFISRGKFEKLTTSNINTDVKVHMSQYKSMNFHKCVLNQSSFLKKLIDDSNEIDLKKWPYPVTIEVFAYLYTNSFATKDLNSLLQLISLSRKLELIEMEKMCYIKLKKFLSTQNLLSLYKDSGDNQNLKILLSALILDNLSSFSINKELEDTYSQRNKLQIPKGLNTNEYFQRIMNHNQYHDIHVQTSDGKMFTANRFIFSLFTDYFDEFDKKEIPFELKSLELTYKSLFQKQFNDLSIDEILTILDISKFIKISTLMKELTEFLVDNINNSNVTDIFIWTKNVVSFQSIQKHCENFMKNSTTKLSTVKLSQQQNIIESKIIGIKKKLNEVQSNNEQLISLVKRMKE
eukprot:gene2569-3531_t